MAHDKLARPRHATHGRDLVLALIGVLASCSLACSAEGDDTAEQIAALCAQTKGIELEVVNDFELAAPNTPAPGFYAYDDNSLDADNPDRPSTELCRDLDFFNQDIALDENDPTTWDPLAFCSTPGVAPPASQGSPANNKVLRFRGPISVLGTIDPMALACAEERAGTVRGVPGFVNWGAGFSGAWSPGVTALEDAMKAHLENPDDPAFPPPDMASAPYDSADDAAGFGKDASVWEGIAFWARLGDEGASQLQVGVHDVHTFRGSRLNFVWPPLTGTTTIDGREPFCHEPAYTDEDGTASDQTAYRKQCGDGFMRVLELTSQWRHYRIPFSELRQNGWGAVAPRLATEEIYVLFFGSTPNQPLDILLDDISFYRHVP